MSRSDHLMVVRGRIYDGAGYHKQFLHAKSTEQDLNKRRAEAEAANEMPVVVSPEAKQGMLIHPQLHIVLNYSMYRWKDNLLISEVDNMQQEIALLPERGRPMFKEEDMVVADVAFTTKEQLDLMKSDFRYLAELLIKLRTGEPYDFREAEVIHLNELMQAFAAFTGDPGWLTYQMAKKTDGGDKKVYNLREVVENRGASRVVCKTVLSLKQKHGYSTEQALDDMDASAEEQALYYQASGEQAP